MNTTPVVLEGTVTPQDASSKDRVPRILFADRDPQICKSCLTAFIRANYQVEVCEDGESAWRALLKKPFDLLVASQDMPKLSGLALIRQLRLANIDIPIILIAQGAITDSVSHDPWHRIAAVLLRPFTTEQLLRAAHDVLASERRPEPCSSVQTK